MSPFSQARKASVHRSVHRRTEAKGSPQDFYFAADDVPHEASLLGLTVFLFACYGAGTPRLDDFASDSPRSIAPRAFVSRLPQRLLGHPGGGALAVVGHGGARETAHNDARRYAVFGDPAVRTPQDGSKVGASPERL